MVTEEGALAREDSSWKSVSPCMLSVEATSRPTPCVIHFFCKKRRESGIMDDIEVFFLANPHGGCFVLTEVISDLWL